VKVPVPFLDALPYILTVLCWQASSARRSRRARGRALCEGTLESWQTPTLASLDPLSRRRRSGRWPDPWLGPGHLAQAVDGVAIPYADLPAFPHVGVSGHNPHLHIGTLEGVRVAVFGAREHYYESGKPSCDAPALAGAEGAGGKPADPDQRRRLDAPRHSVPGSVMLLSDHINYRAKPLIGEKDRRPLRADDRCA
jgi:hypothetical protein